MKKTVFNLESLPRYVCEYATLPTQGLNPVSGAGDRILPPISRGLHDVRDVIVGSLV
jgi:hypothetical protein